MSVKVDVDAERGAFFHSWPESFVHTVHISRPIECSTINVLYVKIELINRGFH